MRASRAVELILRLVVGGLFIYASIDKIIHVDEFADILGEYQMLRDGYVNPLAMVLPWVELATGFCLVCGLWVPSAALISTVLTALFMGAIAWALHLGIEDFHCGCFNTLQEQVDDPLKVLWRDAVLLAATVALVLLSYTREAQEGSDDP